MELNKIITNEDLSKLYEDYGDDFVAIIIRELRSADKVSSGKMINSLNSDLQIVGNKLAIKIKGEDYFINIDNGRRPGSYPPISEISKWATLKGIPQSSVFAMAKNIYKFGIKPTNVLKKAVSKLTAPTKELEYKMAKQIEEDLVNEIKNNI
jgi:hypothetical protein